MTRRRQWVFAIFALLFLCLGGYFLWRSGFFSALSSSTAMETYINQFSPYGQCIFFFIQLFSVIFAPIPSNITALAGAVLFGMWQAFFLTFSAVILGSMLVFSLSRILGRSFADKLVNKKLSEKYIDIIKYKQDIFLFLVFLFPFFPDDLICIAAGLTKIPSLRFLIISVIARPWGLLVSCAVGNATVSIPIWGMALLGIGGLIFLAVGLKFGDNWEQKLISKLNRK